MVISRQHPGRGTVPFRLFPSLGQQPAGVPHAGSGGPEGSSPQLRIFPALREGTVALRPADLLLAPHTDGTPVGRKQDAGLGKQLLHQLVGPSPPSQHGGRPVFSSSASGHDAALLSILEKSLAFSRSPNRSYRFVCSSSIPQTGEIFNAGFCGSRRILRPPRECGGFSVEIMI